MTKFEKQLQNEISALPESVEPERDLWKGIELAISEEKQQLKNNGKKELVASMPLYAMAASIMFLAFALYTLIPNSDVHLLNQTAPALTMQNQHQEQKQSLLVSFANRTPLAAGWKDQMKELDAAEKAILTALENDPDNLALLKMLQQVYQQQLSLIETVYDPKWQAI